MCLTLLSGTFFCPHTFRQKKNHYIAQRAHKPPQFPIRGKIYCLTREFLRHSIVANVTINSGKMANRQERNSTWKNQDSKRRAVTIVTIGQPVFAYFSVIGKGIE